MTTTALGEDGFPAIVTLREPDGTTRRFELFESSSVLRPSQLVDKNGSNVDYRRDVSPRI